MHPDYDGAKCRPNSKMYTRIQPMSWLFVAEESNVLSRTGEHGAGALGGSRRGGGPGEIGPLNVRFGRIVGTVWRPDFSGPPPRGEPPRAA